MYLRLYSEGLPPIIIPCRTKLHARIILDRWVGQADKAELYRGSFTDLNARPIQTYVPAVGRKGWARAEGPTQG
jgi:hypothetical protein